MITILQLLLLIVFIMGLKKEAKSNGALSLLFNNLYILFKNFLNTAFFLKKILKSDGK
jgi:hypothetical protein